MITVIICDGVFTLHGGGSHVGWRSVIAVVWPPRWRRWHVWISHLRGFTDAPARFVTQQIPTFMSSLPLRDAPLPRSPVARFREEVLFFVRQPGTAFKGSAEFYCVGCVIAVEADGTTGAVQVRWQDTFTVNLRWLSSSSPSSFPCFRSELQVVCVMWTCYTRENMSSFIEQRGKSTILSWGCLKITLLFFINVIESLIYFNFLFYPAE